MKKQTQEEVSKKTLYDAFDNWSKNKNSYDKYDVLNFGAKWQAKQMYTEDEVELIANEMVNWAIDNIGNPNPESGKKFDEVLNKFKKIK